MSTRITPWNAFFLFGATIALYAGDRSLPPSPAPPLITADIRLTGVMHLRNAAPKAYLMVAEYGCAPDWITLSLGERSGCLEIIEIDALKGRVTLRYRDVLMTLSLSGHGVDEQFSTDAAEQQFTLEHSRSAAELERRQVAEDLRERAEAEQLTPATGEELAP